MNRLVTAIVATLTISLTVAWWVLLAQGATWLVSNWTAPPAVVVGSEVAQNTPPTSFLLRPVELCPLMAMLKPYCIAWPRDITPPLACRERNQDVEQCHVAAAFRATVPSHNGLVDVIDGWEAAQTRYAAYNSAHR